MKQFNWHAEKFAKTLKAIGDYARQFSGTCEFTGWLDWFAENHQEAHNKLIALEDKLNALWGQADPRAMEDFKKLLKQYEEGTKWGVNKFIESLKERARAGEQEIMSL